MDCDRDQRRSADLLRLFFFGQRLFQIIDKPALPIQYTSVGFLHVLELQPKPLDLPRRALAIDPWVEHFILFPNVIAKEFGVRQQVPAHRRFMPLFDGLAHGLGVLDSGLVIRTQVLNEQAARRLLIGASQSLVGRLTPR